MKVLDVDRVLNVKILIVCYTCITSYVCYTCITSYVCYTMHDQVLTVSRVLNVKILIAIVCVLNTTKF
jgi:hypothetical protein